MRRRRIAPLEAGTESLVDVLANTIGGLALLSILAALDAGNLRWQLFISEERPADTRPVPLVVAGDRLWRFDVEALGSRVAALPPGSHRLPAAGGLPFDVAVDKDLAGEADLRLSLAPASAGDPVSEFLAGRGMIAGELARLDGARQHVQLYLAPDSFHLYLDLRAGVRAAGLQLGWTALPEPLLLRYGAGAGGQPLIEFGA
jgi:hypothetical protein